MRTQTDSAGRKTKSPSLDHLGGRASDGAENLPQGVDSKQVSHKRCTVSNRPEACAAPWHPVLRPMRDTCARMLDAGEARAGTILDALAVLKNRRSFWQPAAHPHFRRNADEDEACRE